MIQRTLLDDYDDEFDDRDLDLLDRIFVDDSFYDLDDEFDNDDRLTKFDLFNTDDILT